MNGSSRSISSCSRTIKCFRSESLTRSQSIKTRSSSGTACHLSKESNMSMWSNDSNLTLTTLSWTLAHWLRAIQKASKVHIGLTEFSITRTICLTRWLSSFHWVLSSTIDRSIAYWTFWATLEVCMAPWVPYFSSSSQYFNFKAIICSWWKTCSIPRRKVLRACRILRGKKQGGFLKSETTSNGTVGTFLWQTVRFTALAVARWASEGGFCTRTTKMWRKRFMWRKFWSSFVFWKI